MPTPRRSTRTAASKRALQKKDEYENIDDSSEGDLPSEANEVQASGQSDQSYADEENTSKRSPNLSSKYSSPKCSPINVSQSSRTSSPGSHSSSSFNTSPGGNKLYSDLHSPKSSLYPKLDEIFPESLTPRNKSVNLNNSNRNDNVSTKQSASDSKEKSPNLWVCAFLILLIGFIAYALSIPSSGKSHSNLTPFNKYVVDIDNLKQLLPNQKKRLWTTIKASVKHILNESQSDYPSVILMASDIKTKDIALCLAKLITAKFESAHGLSFVPFVADIDVLKQLSNMEQKKKLDEDLRTVFIDHKSAIINNLQMLSPEAALLLHAYCDNDNAPFKDVMIVLIFYIDVTIQELDPDRPNIVENYLEELWSKELHVDKVSAIMSRVANNIVVVSEENKSVLNSACSRV